MNKPTNNKKNIKKEAPKECYFTKTGTVPNYKDVLILRRFINDRGKLIPQSRSGVSARNQRLLSVAVKRAREMALLPYTDKHAI